MTRVSPIKPVLFYNAKILICKLRIIYGADRDPVINNPEEEGRATVDELAVATHPLKTKTNPKKVQVTVETALHSPGFALAL